MGATKQLYRYQAALGDIYYPNNPNRGNCVGVPLNPDGSCTFVGVLAPYGNPTTEINNYSGLLGAWYRRGSALRANINAKFGGADNWIYRIDPLRSFNINANVSYAPQSWLTLSGNLLLQHAKNYDSDLAYNQHNYSVLVDASIMPNPRWGFDLAYNFDALQQNANVCFASSAPPAGSYTCNGDDTLLETYGIYQTHTQYGYFAASLAPIEVPPRLQHRRQPRQYDELQPAAAARTAPPSTNRPWPLPKLLSTRASLSGQAGTTTSRGKGLLSARRPAATSMPTTRRWR